MGKNVTIGGFTMKSVKRSREHRNNILCPVTRVFGSVPVYPTGEVKIALRFDCDVERALSIVKMAGEPGAFTGTWALEYTDLPTLTVNY